MLKTIVSPSTSNHTEAAWGRPPESAVASTPGRGTSTGWPLADALFAVAVAAFIVISHHDNIARLLSGRERKLGQSAEG